MTMPPMQELSFWDLVKDSPEWSAVFAGALFAVVTVGLIASQVWVMIWQGRNSERHELAQNRLLRLQFEREWLTQTNREREQLLKLARKLHRAAGCLKEEPSNSDPSFWIEVMETAEELDSRLKILDGPAFMGENDNWFPNLEGYVDAILQAVRADSESNEELKPASPNQSTRKALKEADDEYQPVDILLDLEAAIRMGFLDFKSKWDTEVV
jgi:hypothetical protein